MEVYLPDYLTIPAILYKDREIKSLDRDVYGIVYWFARQKQQRCTLSNKAIGSLINAKAASIANSLSRLAKKGYVTVILDDKHHRVETIPNITYTPNSTNPSSINDTPSFTNDTPFIHRVIPPSSTDEQNKRIKNKREGGAATSATPNSHLKDKPEKHLSYLDFFPEEDFKWFTSRYNVTPQQIKSKARAFASYCRSKGRIYKDYKQALANAIQKDYGDKDEEFSSMGYKIIRSKEIEAEIKNAKI